MRGSGRPRAALHLRRGLLLVAAATALTAVLAGLARMGVMVGWGPPYVMEHGPLFVLGVLATVIGLERAVGLGRPWAYAAPATGAAAALAMLTGASWPWPGWLATASCALTVPVNVAIVRRQPTVFTALMLVGSLLLTAGAAAWAAGRPVFEAVPAWIGFFVLTIAAERLELSRLAPRPPAATAALLVAIAACVAAAVAPLVGAGAAPGLLGASLVVIGGWQLLFDVARRTIRRAGLPRFTAAAILAGSAWLTAGGALVLWRGLPPAGPQYDAALHAVFVGHVLSMIFAHAPIIVPAVARTALPFHPSMWLALAVLHLGLAARIAGDLTLDHALRQHGSVASAVALALFAASAVAARLLRRRPRVLASRRGEL